ncbi:hypothetical protein [Zavarzinia sp. CC-PAN008]|uniref:hypothetical protein n=1 Tax=Zavarzinia sp. CC-PAN008 TaxID=3243332 RepID=UPI003F742FE4
MKLWSGFAVLGLVLVLAIVLLRHDLRGWTPADLTDPASVVLPSREGAPAFALGECLPGTIDPYDLPMAGEETGSATMTVLTCRGRSSAAMIVIGYVVAAAGVLLILAARARRTS